MDNSYRYIWDKDTDTIDIQQWMENLWPLKELELKNILNDDESWYFVTNEYSGMKHEIDEGNGWEIVYLVNVGDKVLDVEGISDSLHEKILVELAPDRWYNNNRSRNVRIV